MTNVFLFIPKATLTSRQNLDEFVLMCRDRLTVFGSDLDWFSHSWKKVGNFTKIGAPSRGYTDAQLLDSGIMSFAKAYVRYQQGHNPTKLKSELKAIRCIEPALLEIKGCADITLTDICVLEEACRVAQTYGATAYQAGVALVKLVGFLNQSGMIPAPIDWRNPIKKPTEIDRLDDAGRAKRDEKMPLDSYLDAMAEMFSNDLQDPRDRFTTSLFALLMCAPSRITEMQELPVNCLHREIDSKGVERMGFRFYAGKGYGAQIKWIPTSLVGVAQEAVRRLTQLSAPGRALAKWLEERPNEFYRHEGCPSVEEDQALSPEQALDALGMQHGSDARSVLKAKLKSYPPFADFYAEHGYVTLRFLNKFVRTKLPEGWPWLSEERGVKYSEALCCFREDEFHEARGTKLAVLWAPGKSTFTTDINYIDGQERSIWERYGYKNADGSPISMSSHQVRHFLNTAAQRGDLGQLDIAKWSGRANIHQNATYNHMTDAEHVEMAREAGIGTALGKIRQNQPVTLVDLEAATADDNKIAHVTIFGFCVHDFSMLPCQKFRDCTNCTEHVCVKGDDVKRERLRAQRDSIRVQLAKAQKANEAGIYGADRWSQHQIKTLARTEKLLELLDSDSVPDGSVIHLNADQEFSPLKRAIAARSTGKSLPAPKTDEPEIDELRALLGI